MLAGAVLACAAATGEIPANSRANTPVVEAMRAFAPLAANCLVLEATSAEREAALKVSALVRVSALTRSAELVAGS